MPEMVCNLCVGRTGQLHCMGQGRGGFRHVIQDAACLKWLGTAQITTVHAAPQAHCCLFLWCQGRALKMQKQVVLHLTPRKVAACRMLMKAAM